VPAQDLSDHAKSIVKLYQPQDGSPSSFVKQQCMHCVDPACVASCMFRALHKDAATGVVQWTPGRCVGCRYCEIACPYHVPRFQWAGFNPRIVKCEMCAPRLAEGKEPACSAVCPTHAVIYGRRTELLDEAHRRIAASNGKYFENRVYGEREGGGTQAFYLSRVAFEKIGLPRLGSESIPAKYLKWQKRAYKYLAAPVAAYALLVGVIGKRWRQQEVHEKQEEESTKLRSQL
jgi:Fe-S-cluster-containing dehydrogenase component